MAVESLADYFVTSFLRKLEIPSMKYRMDSIIDYCSDLTQLRFAYLFPFSVHYLQSFVHVMYVCADLRSSLASANMYLRSNEKFQT